MTSRSLAAVFYGVPGIVELQELTTPTPRGPEVLVKVESCTLCGSDLHSIEGRRKVPVPTILGHEIVGRIEAFGPEAVRRDFSGKPLSEGDRVVWALVAACGRCLYCQRDLPQKCLSAVKYGHEAFRTGYELLGGLAERCLLTPGTAIVRVPEKLTLNTISPAGCATATIASALEATGDLRGRVVCIAGAGLLGLTAAAMSRSRSADVVIVCDVQPARLDWARRFGATHCVHPDGLTPLIRELTSNQGVDIALEVSGAPQAFESLFPNVRMGGQLLLIGAVFPSAPVPIAIEQIVRRNLTLRGIHNYGPDHLVQAVNFLDQYQEQFPFDRIVADWFSLRDVASAITAAHNPNVIRVGVIP